MLTIRGRSCSMRLCAAVSNIPPLKATRSFSGAVSRHDPGTTVFLHVSSIQGWKTMTDHTAASRNGPTENSLKQQNRWQLWIIVAVNSLFLWGVIQANAIRLDGIRGLFSDVENLLPMGFAIVIATVLNGI